MKFKTSNLKDCRLFVYNFIIKNADAAGPLEGWSTYGGYARLPRITVNIKSPRKPCVPPVRTPTFQGSGRVGVLFIFYFFSLFFLLFSFFLFLSQSKSPKTLQKKISNPRGSCAYPPYVLQPSRGPAASAFFLFLMNIFRDF